MNSRPDTDAMLRAIVLHVVEKSREDLDPELLSKDPQRLHEALSRTRVKWKEVAVKCGTRREVVYHWYWETFRRR